MIKPTRNKTESETKLGLSFVCFVLKTLIPKYWSLIPSSWCSFQVQGSDTQPRRNDTIPSSRPIVTLGEPATTQSIWSEI